MCPFLLRTCETKCVNERQEASTSHCNRESHPGFRNSNGLIFTIRSVSLTTCYVKTVTNYVKQTYFKLIMLRTTES
jgi:hypothetical protein